VLQIRKDEDLAKRKNVRVRKVNTTNWGQRGVSIPLAATILVPSGQCPFVIDEYSRENVIDWIIDLTEEKHEVITYDRNVYTYWLRHSFSPFSQDYNDAKEIVEEIVPDRVKGVKDLML